MSWGCKPENHPNGCGWAARNVYPVLRLEEWWCDLCERSGDCATPTTARPPLPPTDQAAYDWPQQLADEIEARGDEWWGSTTW